MENKNVNIKEIDSLPQLEVLTFMSWDNNYFVRNNEITLRAIALCYPNGFFKVAINCMRDGSMGEPDENGVYERQWTCDFLGCPIDSNIRPATKEEVNLYLKYCPINDEKDLFWELNSFSVFGFTVDDNGYHVIIKKQKK